MTNNERIDYYLLAAKGVAIDGFFLHRYVGVGNSRNKSIFNVDDEKKINECTICTNCELNEASRFYEKKIKNLGSMPSRTDRSLRILLSAIPYCQKFRE